MISVFIVDDHPVVVEGIRSLLINEEGIFWAGHALNAASCISYLEKITVDVILMDINLPDKSGIELCAEIKKNKPDIQILALSTLNQPSYIRKMIENGAGGYILKNADKEELLVAIKDVAAGKTHLCLEALEVVKHMYNSETGKPILTRREKEILILIAEGLTNAEMAEKLFVSQWTIDSHRKSIMTKLNTKNTAMLIKYAIENGLV
ncbi:response regulator [Mucilaginibacter gotjawali]|uniref:DNA-binding NarL/FixJ family response regulator n=2 Tax=Mucilaginibacter gotjawali TaxID=1550579 RepID=A0A839S7F2_9SPHI|nr:response regulator transcription factor [Mucilaginibacter gotjawali]MBB3053598.1 DNA-binding NarL/FixJ family response regulator [Mucilaginibacter gotjawali]BAU53858.1 Oxygen regulatory protein NreC [Mucilaginibacter gotjawali]